MTRLAGCSIWASASTASNEVGRGGPPAPAVQPMRIQFLLLVALLALPANADIRDVVIDDHNVFPESLSSTADGTLYIGSNLGRIYRAKPNQAYAEPWLDPPSSGLHEGLRGVLADETTSTLWVCDDYGKESTLARFSLKSGARLASFGFPGGGHCNDIASRNGDVYVTDTNNGRILKLAKGAGVLSEWYRQDDRSLDGLVWTADGKLYTNTYSTHHCLFYKIPPF